MPTLLEEVQSVDGVVAKKKRRDEAAACAALSALLRPVKVHGKESGRIRETSVMVAPASYNPTAPKPMEGPRVHVVLLTEGLGNRRDMNYYGPEAVASMPRSFEGAPMFCDHPSVSEEKDIPERRVRSKVGYFKNLHVESIGGKAACCGEVHFDLSDEGRNAYRKAETAIHYRQYNTGREYVGLSVNASAARAERRKMAVEGSMESVNYVLEFASPAESCDMVTIPARGGAFIALMESVSGARMKKEDTRMETLKRLEAAQAALKEAEGEKDAGAQKTKVIEARQVVDSLLEDIREAAAKATAEAKKREDESEAEYEARKKKEDEAKAKKKESDDEDEDDMPKGKKSEKKESDRKLMKLAVKSLIKESGIAEKYFDVDEMSNMSLEEAEREIKRTKRVHEASVEDLNKVLSGHPARESGLPAVDGKANINEAFAVPKA